MSADLTLRQRFWSKVDKAGDCWLWTAAKDRKGYGKFSVGHSHNDDGTRRNSMVSAHRFAFESENGRIPGAAGFHGMCVLHRCDNPSCVRPSHLFLGTNAENVLDMDKKGRRVVVAKCGSAHANAILNESQVRAIVEKHRAGGVTQVALARAYGVSSSTINHIFKGRLWAHLGLANRSAK